MAGAPPRDGWSPADRTGAVGIAVIAALTLLTRVYLRTGEDGSVFAALAFLSQFFTILTNALVLLIMLLVALGRDVPVRGLKAVVIAIVMVGIVYHRALAHLVSFEGLAFWADHGVHTVVPMLTALWWLAFARRPPLAWRDLAVWVAWPLSYCVYILVRAHFSGFYPYPFLNLPELGWDGLAVSIAGLVLGFIVIGLLLTALARVLDKLLGARPGGRAEVSEG